jgi:DNA-binding transcriptional MerR regulator
MSQQCLPGTNIQMDLQGGQDYRRAFDAAFAMTGGIYLSQLADMVGVPGATLQNWVKRGYVSSPVNKRYTRRQTCRIILIALLRHTLALEEVAELLSWINNNLADEQDDLIDDSDLYLLFCDVVLALPPDSCPARDELAGRISSVTMHYEMPEPQDRNRLNQVLLVMVLAYGAWQLKISARDSLAGMKKGEST